MTTKTILEAVKLDGIFVGNVIEKRTLYFTSYNYFKLLNDTSGETIYEGKSERRAVRALIEGR